MIPAAPEGAPTTITFQHLQYYGLSVIVVSAATPEGPLSTDTVEKLQKRIAAKIRRSELVCENRCAMLPQSSYSGRLLLQRQFLCPSISFSDRRAHGAANFDSLSKTDFFNSIDPLRKFGSEFSMKGVDP
jgi:hypothetical protein